MDNETHFCSALSCVVFGCQRFIGMRVVMGSGSAAVVYSKFSLRGQLLPAWMSQLIQGGRSRLCGCLSVLEGKGIQLVTLFACRARTLRACTLKEGTIDPMGLSTCKWRPSRVMVLN